MSSVIAWILIFRAASLVISATLYFMVLLVLLDIAEMWSRSYRTFGYKEVKKGFGRASIWLV